MTAAGFRIRKVKTEQHSIGDRLKRARMRKKISVTEAEEATKIRAKFIMALESDSWDLIPSEVYGRGYLENYAMFLKLPVDQIMKQYEKERTHYARHCQDAKAEFAPKSNLQLPKFYITPKLLFSACAVAGVMVIMGMVTHQLRVFASAPFLEITNSRVGVEYAASGHTFVVTGKTWREATVAVNGAPVTVSEVGDFSYPVEVQKGINAVVVEASAANGKKSTETLSVTVP